MEIIGAFRVCFDTAGKVTDVDLIRSTGSAAYDQELENGIRTWVYSPYQADGKPIAVCTHVTFKYRPR